MSAALAFELPPALEAHEPPEARGLARDDVRLMVSTRADGAIAHARFRDLPELLEPGDLLVVNTSATLPAAVRAHRRDGAELELRFATPAPDVPGEEWWVVEPRAADGSPLVAERARRARSGALRAGERLTLPGRAIAELAGPYDGGQRLWLARLELDMPLYDYLWSHGHPIRYSYAPGAWPLGEYQTAYALEPGSAEMPSAGRPFTPELITRLVAGGVLAAPLVLHTGVSSPEADEPPQAEHYRVPTATARLVNAVRDWGGRVIAVGTTVVRALETVARPDGEVEPGMGWTSLVITSARGLRAVDGLLTGWHEPRASHLLMLEAVAGAGLLERSYAEALEQGYLWHEFGDSHLILP